MKHFGKKLLLVISFLCAVFLVQAQTTGDCATDPDNLITANPGFEDGGQNWNLSGGSTDEITTTDAYCGTHSLLVKANDSFLKDISLDYDFTNVTSTYYMLSFWYKAPDPLYSFDGHLYAFDNNYMDNVEFGSLSVPLPAATEWTKVSLVFPKATSTPNNAATPIFDLEMWLNPISSLLLDQVSLKKVSNDKPVKGVSLDNTSLSLAVGAQGTLTATLNPYNATYQTLYWKSTDYSVATVDANGTVTGVKAGTAKIQVFTADGGYYAKCAVTVTAPKQDQTIQNFGDNITKTVGDADFDLAATATSGLAVTYTSSNTAVATISGSTVHIVGVGSTTITASQAGNGTYNAATDVMATLTVSPQTTGDCATDPGNLLSDPGFENGGQNWLLRSTDEITTTDAYCGTHSLLIKANDQLWNDVSFNYDFTNVTDKTYMLSFWYKAPNPLNSFSGGLYAYSTNYSNNAKFSSLTVALPVATEWTKVSLVFPKATSTPNNAATPVFDLQMWPDPISNLLLDQISLKEVSNDKPVKGVSLDNTSLSLAVGAQGTLTATLNPYNATYQTLYWKSTDYSVATVDANGTVTGVKAGTAKIQVFTADGGYYAQCAVTVTTGTSTSINEVSTQLPVRVVNGNVVVSAKQGSTVEVFTALGIKLQSQTAYSDETTITGLPKSQVLFVRSGNAVAKVIL